MAKVQKKFERNGIGSTRNGKSSKRQKFLCGRFTSFKIHQDFKINIKKVIPFYCYSYYYKKRRREDMKEAFHPTKIIEISSIYKRLGNK